MKDTSEGRLVMGLYHDGGWYRSVIRENLPGRKVRMAVSLTVPIATHNKQHV